MRRTRRSPACPTPHTGVRCCCVSSTQPDGVDLAVEVHGELRARGRPARRRRRGRSIPSAADESAGDAEVAVEPGVVEDAAVHLDGELLPAEDAARRDAASTRRHGESVWPPTMRNGSAGSVAPSGRRQAIRRRVADDVAGRRHVRSTSSASSSRSKPVSRSIVDSTACHGDGDASRKSIRSSTAASGRRCGTHRSMSALAGTGPSGGRCRAGGSSR